MANHFLCLFIGDRKASQLIGFVKNFTSRETWPEKWPRKILTASHLGLLISMKCTTFALDRTHDFDRHGAEEIDFPAVG